MLHLARRSSALASSRRVVSALLSLRLPLPLPALPPPRRPASSFPARDIHYGGGGLGFRASDVVRAQHAVDVFAYEEKSQQGKADEAGLEIANLGIAEVIVKELAKRGITKLFPIQRAVLEPAMQGRDMIGRAKTGTGKTLAFGIPIIDKIIQFNLKHGRGRNPLALVLAPTRELARQVEKEFRESSDLDTICVYGGSPINQQIRALDYGVDVVVGTPGRVIDLLKRGAMNLSEVQFLVLDEADQMLAVGFAEDVEIILERLPTKRQSMMFSATMPDWIRKLTRKFLKDPVVIDLVGDSDQKIAEGITLYSIASDPHGKAAIIGPLVTEHAKGGKCIVFTQTKRDADRLAYYLSGSLKCEPLHGDISQSQRERTLSGFRDGRFNILVATDVAARGLDIPNVDLIIHYELPNSPEIFVHRSGRTGRAGKKGTAIAIYTEFETREVRMIEQHIGCRFNELSRIKVEGGGLDIMRGDRGRRFDSPGRSRFDDSWSGSGRGRGSDFGGSGFGRSGGYSSSRGQSFGSGDRNSGRFGFFATGSSDSRFGRSGGFGSPSSKTGGFGNRSSDGFGNTSSGGFGSLSSRSSGLGNTSSLFDLRPGSSSHQSNESVRLGFGRTGDSVGSFKFGNSAGHRPGSQSNSSSNEHSAACFDD